MTEGGPEIPDELYEYFGKTPPPRPGSSVDLKPAPRQPEPRRGGTSAYAEAALQRELAELALSPAGGRNHALNVSALKLARLPIDRDLLRADLIQACHANRLVSDDGLRSVEATIKSAFTKADLDGPRDIPSPVRTIGWHDDPGLPQETAGQYEAGDDDYERQRAWQIQVSNRAQTIRLDREARRIVDAEDRPPVEPPPVRSLDVLLAEPDTAAAYLVDELAPAGGRVMLSAQYKAGKTTLVGNLLRSLADREPFLDRFSIPRAVRRIALVDTELDGHTLRRWLRDQNITNRQAVVDVVGLRGKVAALNLIDDRVRAQWATRFRELQCDYLILDCLRPVLDALGLDEHRDAGQFLVAFDALLAEAGIPDALMVQHMGHSNERARGDSRLQDWPDAIWRLVREDDEPGSPRFFSAYGRDVDVHEGRLTFDADTRHLAYVDGSRKDSKTEAATPDVMAVLAEQAQQGGLGLSGRQIESAVAAGEHTRNAIRDALKTAIQRGLVVVIDGPRRSKLHQIANPCSECGQPLTAGQSGQHLECGADS